MRAITSSRRAARRHAVRRERAKRRTSKPAFAREETAPCRPGSTAVTSGPTAAHDAAVHLGRPRSPGRSGRSEAPTRRVLDDEVIVQRLEGRVGEWRPFQHGFTILRACRSVAHDVPVPTRTRCSSRARAEEDRPRLVLRRRCAVRAAPPAPASVPHEALSRTASSSEFFHQKRVPSNHPEYVDEQFVAVPERPFDRLRDRRQRRRARLGGEPRVHRAAHVALARARHRAARLPAHRPRPDLRRAVEARPRDRARRQRGAGRAGPAELPEDLRARPGCTSSRRSSRSSAFPEVRRLAKALAQEVERRVGDQARGDDDLEGGRPASACSSTTARTRATGRSPSAYSMRPDARRAGLGAARLGRGARPSSRSGSR